LQETGFRVTYLPVNAEGFVNPEDVEKSICDDTILISIMMANNEIGTLQPIVQIGKIARSRGILFHTDAAQMVGKIRFNIDEMPVDFLSLSAHKMYGPKGIGALFIKPIHLMQKCPLIQGGGQEKGMRSGTLNVPGIVGFGKACQIAANSLDEEVIRQFKMKKLLYQMLSTEIPELLLNGPLENSLPNTLNVSIPSIDSVKLLSHLKNQFSLSTGSACTSTDQEYSHVLKAIGRNEREGKSSLRISFGKFTCMNDIECLGMEIIRYAHASNAHLSIK
jgi:cysteine desulfurase